MRKHPVAIVAVIALLIAGVSVAVLALSNDDSDDVASDTVEELTDSAYDQSIADARGVTAAPRNTILLGVTEPNSEVLRAPGAAFVRQISTDEFRSQADGAGAASAFALQLPDNQSTRTISIELHTGKTGKPCVFNVEVRPYGDAAIIGVRQNTTRCRITRNGDRVLIVAP